MTELLRPACWRSLTIDPHIILPLFWERLKAKTTHLTTDQRGAYVWLLMHQWQHGYVPAGNLQQLAQIIGGTKASARSIWTVLSSFFADACPCGCDLRRNRSMEEKRADQQRRSKTATENGAKGGRPRKPNETQIETQTETQREPGKKLPNPDPRSGSNNESKNDSLFESGKPHPIRDFLAKHERLFLDRYGEVPAKYTGKDAKHAQAFLDAHGDRALILLEQFFASRDPFIASSGHGLGVLAASNVQNKLIAEISGRAPRNDGRDWAREFVNG